MAEHEVVALHQNFETWKKDRASGLTDIEPFLYYSVEHITKQYNLSDEQVRYGITDDSNDGGIDAFYCLAGKKNVLLRDDVDAGIAGADTIRIIVFQVKSSLSATGFKPGDIDHFTHFTDYLLTLSPIDIAGQYTERILTRMQTFKDKYLEAAGSFPRLILEFYYVTRGDDVEINKAEEAARTRLYTTIQTHRGANSKDQYELFLTDTERLLNYVRARRQQSRPLKWAQQPIPVGDGYVGMVRLTDYYEFLKKEDGDLDELIFESNVRGSQGKTSVNKKIRAALDVTFTPLEDGKKEQPDFWKLNNGITITCLHISPIDAFNLEVFDAQVVNGLQTSRQIFGHFSDPKATVDDSRLVMIKLIPVADDEIRDTIIRATNNQNTLKASALRATDERQREIHDLFYRYDLFYDRRPGFYKDLGKPIKSIVSLNEIVQAVVALVLHRPDDARGRPGDYVKEGRKWDVKYNSIFGSSRRRPIFPLGIYLKSVLIIRQVEDFLGTQASLTRGDRHNLLFYVAFHAVCELAGNATPTAEEILGIESVAITKTRLKSSLGKVLPTYIALAEKEDNPDVAAKGTELLASLKQELLNTHGSRSPIPVKPAISKRVKDIIKNAEIK